MALVSLNIGFKEACCRLAGLDPKTVTKIVFTLTPSGPPLMEVERIVPDVEQNEWQTLIEEYPVVHRRKVGEEFTIGWPTEMDTHGRKGRWLFHEIEEES